MKHDAKTQEAKTQEAKTQEAKSQAAKPHDATPDRDDRAPTIPSREEVLHRLYTFLLFWTVCADKRCGRARACRGDVDACRERWWPHVPEELKIQIRTTVRARRAGLSPAECIRAAHDEVRRCRALDARLAQQRAELQAAAGARAGGVSPPAQRQPDAPSPRVRIV